MPYIGHIRVRDLTTLTVLRLYNPLERKGLSPKSIHYIHGMLHGMLDMTINARISALWSIGDSNWPRVIPGCPILSYLVVLCCHIEQIRHTQSHVIPPG